MKRTTITCEELAERIKDEIFEDVLNGIVPLNVGSFSQLHDFVDANCYGGTEALLDELDSAAPDTDEGHTAALNTLCDLANPAMEIVDSWIKSGGVTDALEDEKRQWEIRDRFCGRRPLEFRLELVDVEKLIAVEGAEPALGRRYSLNDLFAGTIPTAGRSHIARDLATIEHWEKFYRDFGGREVELLHRSESLISINDPPVDDHYIADGFHRLAAARLAGLKMIGAKFAKMFLQI